MAVEKGPKLDWGILANSDLSQHQGRFVKFHGTATVDTVVAIAATTDRALGVLNNAPKAGQEAEVVMTGVVKVELGGTVARNDLIGHDATGLGVTRPYAAAGTNLVYGRALESGVAGQVISVALAAPTPLPAT
jgi:hypothetical protein